MWVAAAVAVFGLTACSGGVPGDGVAEPGTPTTAAAQPVPSLPSSGSDAGTPGQSSTPVVTAAPPGQPIVVDAPSERVEDLSPRCADAAGPLRELLDRFGSGLEIVEEADAAAFNTAIEYLFGADETGAARCSPEELSRLSSVELQPWLTPPPR